MLVDVQSGQTSWRDLYRLCLGFVNPRPIALVSSLSPAGAANLAPFSWYNLVCANPPVVMFSTGLHRDGRPKDTLRNVTASREFVVATVAEGIAEQCVRCASELAYEQSEFDFSGLTPAPAKLVKAPLVRESPVNIECQVRDIVPIGSGPGSASVIFGNIVAIHVADWLLNADGLIDPHKLRTVGRLGGAEYVTVDDPYSLLIPEAPREPEAGMRTPKPATKA